MSHTLEWVDVLGKELDHVVLTKGNCLQVIVRPTRKQLRRRGKRKWSVVMAVEAVEEHNGQVALRRALHRAVQQTLTAMAGGGRTKPESAAAPKNKRGRKS
jgi:hypothetical protein